MSNNFIENAKSAYYTQGMWHFLDLLFFLERFKLCETSKFSSDDIYEHSKRCLKNYPTPV